jgi:lipopolysaccharide export system permease protein
MILLFIPIGIMVDVAEKIDKFKEKEVPLEAIFEYYLDFMWYFGNLLYPVFLFLAIIWFTSKLANNSEIIAILSSGVSFYRYLRPFMIAAVIVASFAFLAGMYIVPDASKGFKTFTHKYLSRKKNDRSTSELYKQINENEFIYVSSYDPNRKRGNNFTLEHFEGEKMKFKIFAQTIRWVEEDTLFRLINYRKRTFTDNDEIYIQENRMDTIFGFEIKDLAPLNYQAETLSLGALNDFIAEEERSGSPLIDVHLLVRHKRYSIPLSVFILTIIAVAVSSFKKRGGMGVNLAFGIITGFTFIFFDKIFAVLVDKTDMSPALGAWLPLGVFGLLAIVLLANAKR